jgi:DNA primase
MAMHDVAAKFYASTLADAPFGEAVRAYVAKRNIPADLVAKFKLGAAPDSWDALVTCLKRNGFTDAEILQGGLGLQRKSGSGIVDRFRNRMMIPLCDAAGNVVAFTARQLPGATELDGPKYMNSPETPIYKKGDMLYGLHLAKAGMREKKSIIVVEGNLDVVASHKAGVENIVASSSTIMASPARIETSQSTPARSSAPRETCRQAQHHTPLPSPLRCRSPRSVQRVGMWCGRVEAHTRRRDTATTR